MGNFAILQSNYEGVYVDENVCAASVGFTSCCTYTNQNLVKEQMKGACEIYAAAGWGADT